jgi:FtsP/CotA-like multicopper oxidase with cupredoxin domain
MTPPRAGTFIYHTHAGELAQLTGGLYGAMIVRARDAGPDANERVIVLADSSADSVRAPAGAMINGRRSPAPIELTAGTTHRLRFISIGAVANKRLRLLDGDAVLQWTPVAKDGAEFSPARLVRTAADRMLTPGETMDVLVTPERVGTLVLEVTSTYGPPVTTRVTVHVRGAR